MDDYHVIADTLAADITAGRLRAGTRLPPQRRFARERGIAPSTAARVYSELVRRGLVVGEVGRGTFVRGARPRAESALAEPSGARVDLELNFPVLADQAGLLARSLAPALSSGLLTAALGPVGVRGTPAARAAAIELLARDGWAPSAEHLLFTGNGRQAIAAAVAALVPVGERLGVEPMTYPVVKAIAARLGVTLVPLVMDDAGIVPEALLSVHAATPLRAVYLQPTLHNPRGVTMPPQRRADLAAVLGRLDLPAIEDSIYAFLRTGREPLAALAPDHTVLVDSLSKRIAPGLTVGFLATPSRLTERVATAIRSGVWTAAHFAVHAATSWMADGTAATIQEAKRRDAAERQRIVRGQLAGFDVEGDPAAYHCWWRLPTAWRAETFVAAAARRGIAVAPAAAFAVGRANAPNAVRLALASPTTADLSAALATLAALARATPEDVGSE